MIMAEILIGDTLNSYGCVLKSKFVFFTKDIIKFHHYLY